MLELREYEGRFRFTGLEAEPVPSLLREFSAPVKVRYRYTDEELMFLMAHDSDGFNRWDAAQTLAQRVILGLVDEPGEVSIEQVPAGFVQAFRSALSAELGDRALLAEVLTLPAESYLGDQMDVVDVMGIHAAREVVRKRIARDLHTELTDLVERSAETGAYAIEPTDIGRRSLKNLALAYLMAEESREAVALCMAQYRTGHNMTDVIAALALLAASEVPERSEVLADFEARWHEDPLVMDKWFGIQALAPREDTLARVQALMQHPGFSLRNPNKVRALIGTFAAGNPVCFHAADGAGYRFLTDRVLELDPLNPQVASRMMRAMARWRRYDPGRQALMQGQLERVLTTERVSKDLYEIASKCLE
jgi:aminopeptidase N